MKLARAKKKELKNDPSLVDFFLKKDFDFDFDMIKHVHFGKLTKCLSKIHQNCFPHTSRKSKIANFFCYHNFSTFFEKNLKIFYPININEKSSAQK